MDRVPATGSIFFPSAHAGLDHDAEKVLSHVSELLTKSPALGVTIVGYADNSGSKGFNAQLSQKRASSIRDILKTQYNIPEDRVKIYWSGDKNAYGDNAGPQGRAMNRRADILFNFKEDPDLIPSFTTSTGQAPIENMSK
jgi:outer membrane protein OmpA-like peptidoglycan-associated protein